MPPLRRLRSAYIGNSPINVDQHYVLVCRDYMLRGKDGYTSLLADHVDILLGPGEGDQIYEIVLEALSQDQKYEHRYTEIPERSSAHHLRTATSEFKTVELSAPIRGTPISVVQRQTAYSTSTVAPIIEGRIKII